MVDLRRQFFFLSLSFYAFLILKFKILKRFFLYFLLDITLPHLLHLSVLQAKRLRGLILLPMRLTEHHLLTLRRHLELESFDCVVSNVGILPLEKQPKIQLVLVVVVLEICCSNPQACSRSPPSPPFSPP